MHAVATLDLQITEPLTWDEICERYPDQWVCLVEMDFTHPNGLEFRTARVVGHGKSRREPFVQSDPWRAYYDVIGHFYTGSITERPLRPALVIDDEIRHLIRPRR